MATSITMSAPRPAPFFTPLFVAIDRGFLAEQGLEGSMRYGAGLAGMERGEVDFVSGALAYKSFLEGGEVRQIAGLSSRETSHVLMVRPEIESVQQLEHVLLPGGSGPQGERFINELRGILALNGLNLEESGISTDNIPGSHKEQWQMLNEGIGDAATLGAPWWIIAAKQGYRNVGHESDFSPSPSGCGIYVHPERITRTPELVQAFVHAYVKSLRYCLENVDGTLETMMKFASDWGVDSREIAQAAYEEVAPYWKLDVPVDMLNQAMGKMSEKMGRPPIPVTDFVDLRFLDTALKQP